MNLTLVGKTKKGKQRVQQHGSHWRIVRSQDKVNFDSGEGPWLLVTPYEDTDDSVASRWVHAYHDKDFEVVPRHGGFHAFFK